MKKLRTEKKTIPPNDLLNARVAMELPSILENSIEVNKSDRSNNANNPYSHILIGTVAIENDDGSVDIMAVRSVVEERINQPLALTEMNVVGKLRGVNVKKVGSSQAQTTPKGIAFTEHETYTYNIAQFLDDVKSDFDETFSQDVYNRLGMQRSTTKKDVQYLRYSLDISSIREQTEGKVLAKPEEYKAGAKDKVFTWCTSLQISVTNEQAGIEKIGKKFGVKDIDSKVQFARAAMNQAQEMIGGEQWRIGDEGTPVHKGEGNTIKGTERICVPFLFIDMF